MNQSSKINPNTKTIPLLIDRYWDGDTTKEEEEILISYFSQEIVADEFKSTQKYFLELKNLQENHTSLIDETLLVSIPEKKNNFHLQVKHIWYAAAMIVAFVIIILIPKDSQSKSYVMIDGKKYTDKNRIEATFQESLANVKLDDSDILNELKTINIE